MSTTIRKANPAPARKASPRVRAKTLAPGSLEAVSDPVQKAIEAAVARSVAEHHEALLAALVPDPDCIEAMFAQIDRHLDASERMSERLLAGT